MKKFGFWQLILVSLLVLAQAACKPTGSRTKTKDPEGRVLGMWEVKTLEKGGRLISITDIAGETFMEFFRYEKKDKDNKTQITYKFRMEMGGSDRQFDFKLMNDSIQFQQVKGWNDMKIASLDREKGEMVLEQAIDGDVIRWALIPRPDLDIEKEKERKEALKNAKKKKE